MFKNAGFYFTGILLLSLIGFWQSYFSTLFTKSVFIDTSNYIHIHALTMLLWILMLITQAFLISNKNDSLHRVVGKFSYILVPAIILSLLLLAHSQIVLYDYGVSYSRLYILFLQLSLLTIFIIAYTLAIINRKVASRHARYMIATSLTLIDPAVARIPFNFPTLPFSYQVLTFSLVDLILIILIILERKQQHGREVFPIMLVIFLFFQILNLTWTRSTSWDNFSFWFANLPLT